MPKFKNNDSQESYQSFIRVSYFFTLGKKFHKKVNWIQNSKKVTEEKYHTSFHKNSISHILKAIPKRPVSFFLFKGKGGHIAEIKLFWVTGSVPKH